MRFKLSVGIFKTAQHKSIVVRLALLLAPLFAMIVYVFFYTTQTGIEKFDLHTNTSFFIDLYSTSPIFFIFVLLLILSVPIIILSARSRSLADLDIDSVNMKCHLPLFARNLENGLFNSDWFIPLNQNTNISIKLGKRQTVRGFKSPPSSRLNTSTIEFIYQDTKLILNPYLWIPENGEDHRLLLHDATSMTENEVIEALKTCPLITVLNAMDHIDVTLA